MRHEEARDLLASYAIGALSADEAQDLESHVQTCAQCRRELESLRQVTAELAAAVPAVPPPPELRTRVMGAIGQRADVILLPRRWAIGLAAAAAVVIVALLSMSLSLNRQLTAIQQRLAAQEQVLALLAGPTAKTSTLKGSVEASVRFVYDPARKQGALIVSDLRDPGAGFVYQLWLVAGTEPQSAGVFRPVPGRPIIVPVAADFTRYQAVAISVERGPSGAPRPTSTPILVGTI